MRKLLTIVIASVMLGFVVFFVTQLYVSAQTKKGALQVTSSPQSKVYLNNNYVGVTPFCKCQESEMLSSGSYTIRVVPQDSNYVAYQEKVNVTKGVLTVVDRKFEKGGVSDGSIITLLPLDDKNATEVSILSLPEKTTIFLDDQNIGETPLKFTHASADEHIIRMQKTGYLEKTLKVRMQKGYTLVIQAQLSVDVNVANGLSVSASASSTLSPTPVTGMSQTVKILDTPTGFLRVHAQNSLSSDEIGRVNPNETFPLVSQTQGWFQIKLTDGTNGWISNTYAVKQ